MTLQDWAAIGEIVGAMAVVASLVYLAIQIRQNTQQIAARMEADRQEALERNINAANRVRELMLLHPDIASIYTRGRNSYISLAEAEKIRFDLLMRNVLSEFQASIARSVALDPQGITLTGGTVKLDWLLANPGVREWLACSSFDWRPEFEAVLAASLARVEQSGDSADHPRSR